MTILKWENCISVCGINPFVANTPFLYPLKISENLEVFWYFQGVEKRRIGNKWVKSVPEWKFLYPSGMHNVHLQWKGNDEKSVLLLTYLKSWRYKGKQRSNSLLFSSNVVKEFIWKMRTNPSTWIKAVWRVNSIYYF